MNTQTETTLSARYVVYREIAAGGMASVQYGCMLGPHGFSRAVAVKRLHPHLAKDPELVAMFLDEARLTARLVHANIIHTLDVIEAPSEVALVMEYVHGESLWNLLRVARTRAEPVPVSIACSLITSVLHGLHAAHEARSADGRALDIVHRDVSPQNILVGSDGIPRLLDFGIAKALGRSRVTNVGEIKGKLSYIAREQLQSLPVDRRTDVYGASVVLWETLSGVRLFDGPSEQAIVHNVLYAPVERLRSHRSDVYGVLDELVLRGLQRDPSKRFASAEEMALALERCVGLASQSEIAAWLRGLVGAELDERKNSLHALELAPPPSTAPRPPEPLSSTRRMSSPVVLDTTLVAALPVAVPAAPARARARAKWWIAGAAALVSCSLLWTWSATRAAREEPKHPAALASMDDEDVPALEPAPAPSEVPVNETTAAMLTDGTEQSRVEMRAAESGGVVQAPQRRNVGTKARASRKKPEAPSDASTHAPHELSDPCVPFYLLDAHGIRHPKPECI